jgi:uncharacterized membrane protein YbhN (UPF0104 family)
VISHLRRWVAVAGVSGHTWRRWAFIGLKVAVAIGCLFALSRQVDPAGLRDTLMTIEPGWLFVAILLIALEVPLVAERWRLIVASLGHGMYRLPRRDLYAANGFGQFAGQILPSLAGDGVRAVMLRGLGVTLPHAAWSVALDRALGVYTLFVIAFFTLHLPSGPDALGGYLEPIFLAVAVVTACGTLALPLLKPLGAYLETRPRLRLAGVALTETHAAVLGRHLPLLFAISVLVHVMTILCVYVLGRALTLHLPLSDAAVLMVCIMVVTLLPISISGWGVRELAVTAFLTGHGASAEQALLFSVTFGLVVMVATIPGAIHWLLQRNAPLQSVESK